ncbi:MAG: DNA polymerase III subunit gamma/tau [Prevotella sp.]|nr:DNA polymerase III subunit gamma/tau [Prevotella sp.]
MDYIVSARKYRPLTFDTVVGQATLTTTLKNAIKSGKLAHAYLFCGPRGVGKTTCARIFARTINCEHPAPDGEACGECESCRAFLEQRSYNIFELDAASNNSVDDIRQLMEQTRIPPQVGRYKVFIIDEVHMLSAAAFNAFLKTLEEPPAHVIFILATTEKHKLLPTIISRCQIYDFERISVTSIINHLRMVAEKESIAYEEEALAVIAEKADGAMRDALSIFDQVAGFCQGNITYAATIDDLNVLDIDNYFRIIDLALDNKTPDLMVLLNDVINRGFDPGNLCQGLARHVRNVMMAKDKLTAPLLEMSAAQKNRCTEQAARCPAKFLYAALKLLNTCEVNYRQTTNKRLLVELTLIQIAQITQDDEPPAGHRPEKLKNIFQTSAAKVEANVKSAAGKVDANVKFNVESNDEIGENSVKSVTGSNVKTTAETNPTLETANGEPNGGESSVVATKTVKNSAKVAQPSNEAQPKNNAQPSNAGKPATKTSRFGPTFSALADEPDDAADSEPDAGNDAANDAPFNQESLDDEWLRLCQKMLLTPETKGLAARIKNLRPTITNFPNAEIVIENSLFLDELAKYKSQLQTALKQQLSNQSLTLQLRLAEPEEIKPLLSKPEIAAQMRKSNPAMELLFNNFNLEIS